MIEAFHSNWTAPFLRANPNKNYYIDDFEILTTIISALKWRENNGIKWRKDASESEKIKSG